MKSPRDMFAKNVTAVGYWRNKEDSPLYPKTQRLPDVTKLAADDPPYEPEVLEHILAYLNDEKHERVQYRGRSNCRICDCANGSEDVSDGRYRWPSGLGHYLEEHNVKLPFGLEVHIKRDGKRW